MIPVNLNQLGQSGATSGQIPVWDPATKRWKASTPTETTLYSAKGDILVGSGPGARSNLPVGTTGQALVANPAATLGVDWENVVHLIAVDTTLLVDNTNPLFPIIINPYPAVEPLTTEIGGVPDFIWDDDNQLVMTRAT